MTRAKSVKYLDRPFLSINELLDFRFKENANDQIITFAVPTREEQGGMRFETRTYAQIDQLIDVTAYELANHFPPRKIGQPIRIVGIIARTDLDSWINMYALFRLGHAVLILSPNNSVEGMIHLIRKMSCRDIVCHQDSKDAIDRLKNQFYQDEHEKLFLTSWIMINDIEGREVKQKVRTELTYEEESGDFCTILHSSGSTGLPKPLPMAHKAWCRNMFGVDMGGAQVYPFSHFSGIQGLLLGLLTVRHSFFLSSRLPYTSSNLIRLIDYALSQGTSQMFCVPLTLKLLAEVPKGLQLLSKFDFVGYAGSPCPKPLGDRLVEANVNLITFYGATETGFCLLSMRNFKEDKGWDAMRPKGNFADFSRWEEQEDNPNLFELIIEKDWPPLSAQNRPNGAYATSDLFLKHPEIPNAFLFVSRKDDSLLHVHGKKTNPLIIESDLRDSPLIKDALVFGAGKMHTGCLIIPKDDSLTMNDLWDAIMFANKRAPTFSRLEKEMVIILPSTDTFVMTDKSSVIRAKTNKKYESLIEAKYQSFEKGDSAKEETAKRINISTFEQAITTVRKIVNEVMEERIAHLGSIKDDDNLFDKGLDSLAVMKIGNLIRSRIQFLDGAEASETAAFHNPTILLLAKYLHLLSSGQVEDEHDDKEISLDIMRQLLSKYSEQIQPRPTFTETGSVKQSRDGKETILLTGSTGSLGAHLLSNAAQRQEVETVICLCRAKDDKEAQERVNESLAERKLPSFDQLSNRCRILCLKSDVANDHLGLMPEMYLSILQSVTAVVHAAWPVNFRMGVKAFESSLQGCVNLINIAARSHLQHPPHLLFCSSIAAAALHPSGKMYHAIMEEASIDPQDAIPNGYGRSKWIAEALFRSATSKIEKLSSKIIRIGQLSGDIKNGIWNEKEAYPLLIKTAQSIGSVPNLSDHQLYWLPVDVAAEMIVEVVCSKQKDKGSCVFHIASNRSTNWKQIILAIRRAYPQVREVPLEEWLQELRTAKDQDPRTNPAIKLIDYYSSWLKLSPGVSTAVEGSENGIPRYDTKYIESEFASKPEILRHIGALSDDNLNKMISAWQQSGFLA